MEMGRLATVRYRVAEMIPRERRKASFICSDEGEHLVRPRRRDPTPVFHPQSGYFQHPRMGKRAKIYDRGEHNIIVRPFHVTAVIWIQVGFM